MIRNASAVARRFGRDLRLNRPLASSVGLLLVALLVLHIGFTVALQRSNRDAEAQILNQVDLRAATLAEVMNGYQLALENSFELLGDFARLQAEGNPLATGIGIRRRLAMQAQTGRFAITQFGITDSAGKSRWNSTSGEASVDVSDREHFTAHLHGDIGIYISRPLIGRVTRRWAIQVSRRLTDAEGRFLGVAVISLDPLKLADELNSVEGPEGQLIGLWRQDGALLVRTGLPPGTAPPDFIASNFPGPDGRLLHRFVTPLDQQDRFVALRTLPGWPAFVSMSVPANAAMASFQRYRQLARLTEFTLALLLIAGAVGRHMLLARRKLAAGAAVERSEAKIAAAMLDELARILNGVDAAVWVQRTRSTDFDTPTVLNRGCARLLHLPPEAFYPGERFLRRAEPPLTEADRETVYQALLRDGRHVAELRLRCGDGRLRWFRVATTVIGRDGSEVEFVVLMTDIEAQKAAATAAIGAARLATLGEVATGLAHEINQPLAIISLSAENGLRQLRRDPPATSRAIEKLELIEQMAQRASVVGRHLLNFASSKANYLEAVDLQATVDGALLLVGQALREAEVQLEVDMAPSLPPAQGQQSLVEQVLINLLLNGRDALNAVTDRPRRMRISGRHVADEIQLEVSDNGAGIPDAVLPRLFEPFFTTKPDGQGTGLGLSICYGIARSCGGTLSAISGGSDHQFGGAHFILSLKRFAPDG